MVKVILEEIGVGEDLGMLGLVEFREGLKEYC